MLFDDLLEFQLGLALRRHPPAGSRPLPSLSPPRSMPASADCSTSASPPDRTNPFVKSSLISTDRNPCTGSSRPMLCAGKTAIAVYALLAAIAAGRQAVLMAPTEVLATQHWETLRSTPRLASRVTRCLLFGGTPRRQTPRTAQQHRRWLHAAHHRHSGTHPGLHQIRTPRGRRHRRTTPLRRSPAIAGFSGSGHSSDGLSPHVLVMTATPIPRSLCLTQFGDLDVSVIKDLPPGRQKVVTAKVSSPTELSKVWNFLRQQISQGRQAYVVCPRVEGQSEDDAASAEAVFQRLRIHELAGLSIDLLHGRMDREHRHDVMDKFREGSTQVLVSTTVIEVGVNIPNATIMVIQQAERFGIAQLHQLRGRICRGRHQGYCFLLSEAESPEANSRLKALEQSSDGFELAETDARLRGPGDILGLRQSGAMPLRCADPVRDLELLQNARNIAQDLVDSGEFNLPTFATLRLTVLDRFAGLLDLPRSG
ncbi:MAG UNVERIFIED_CONTAM: hypothetical protein LVR18_12305 [Planctomycetaceae bacterium]